jgi:hypothetical protein
VSERYRDGSRHVELRFTIGADRLVHRMFDVSDSGDGLVRVLELLEQEIEPVTGSIVIHLHGASDDFGQVDRFGLGAHVRTASRALARETGSTPPACVP